MKSSSRIIGVLVIVFCIGWVLSAVYKKQQLKNNFKLSEGHVNRIIKPTYKNSNRSIQYEYEVAEKKYSGESGFNVCEKISENDLNLLLVNKSFPVAYSVKDANQSIIIITRKDAAMFNYTIPDSMLVYDSILTCK
ncbi:hypothetical protein ACI6Q2_08890 [Chitinophagaceae bacterium LWZ2-11]